MIKSDFGTVTVHGEKSIIIAELTTLIRVLRDGGLSDADIDHCMERARVPKEELRKEAKKFMEDVLKSMFGGSDDKPKKPSKTVAVAVDADTPAEDIGKKIAEIVAKTLREMKEE